MGVPLLEGLSAPVWWVGRSGIWYEWLLYWQPLVSMGVLVQDVVDKVVHIAPFKTTSSSLGHGSEGIILIDDVADGDRVEGTVGSTVSRYIMVIHEEISDEIDVWSAGTISVQPVVVFRMFLLTNRVQVSANVFSLDDQGGGRSCRTSQGVELVDQLLERDNTVLVGIMVTEVRPEARVDILILL